MINCSTLNFFFFLSTESMAWLHTTSKSSGFAYHFGGSVTNLELVRWCLSTYLHDLSTHKYPAIFACKGEIW